MKESFLTIQRPPVSFYHRILRILLGLVMFVVAIIQILIVPASLLIFAYWIKGVENRGATADTLSLLSSGVFLFIASHVLWVVAALMLAFKRLNPRSIWGTLCVLGGLISYAILYYLFDNLPREAAIVLFIAVVAHFCLAVGAIYFSRKYKLQ